MAYSARPEARRVASRLEELREVRDVVRTLLCEVDAALDALDRLRRHFVIIVSTITKLEVERVFLIFLSSNVSVLQRGLSLILQN